MVKTDINLSHLGNLTSVSNIKCIESAKKVVVDASFRLTWNTTFTGKIVINADVVVEGSDRIHSVT